MSLTSSNTNRNSEKIRIVFLGDQGVGKSSIIDRYTTNRYEQTHTATVGIDFNVKDVNRHGQYYRLQMWDTAGQERYRSLIPTYLKNAQFAVFVYDVTKESSLENIGMWYKLFKEHQDAPGILVANKIDLGNARKLSKQAGQRMAVQLKLKHLQVSAKTGKKVHELFDEVLQMIMVEAKKQELFIQSSRDKMRHFKITQAQADCVNETREDGKVGSVTLKPKNEQQATKVNCCG